MTCLTDTYNARSKPIRAIIVRTFRRRANIGSAHIGHEVAKIIDERMYMLPRGYAVVIAPSLRRNYNIRHYVPLCNSCLCSPYFLHKAA